MDVEQMRAILAGALDWTLCEYWPDGPMVYRNSDGDFVMWQKDWRPDEKPGQMMMVVDSLDKDWFLHVWINKGGQSWTCEAAHGDFKDFGFGKFCEAICMAIACVKKLESTDETTQ